MIYQKEELTVLDPLKDKWQPEWLAYLQNVAKSGKQVTNYITELTKHLLKIQT